MYFCEQFLCIMLASHSICSIAATEQHNGVFSGDEGTVDPFMSHILIL